MTRPKRHRRMNTPPPMRGFKPFGIPIKEMDSITLLFEEYEALKLADYNKLTQAQAAKLMQVSRPTFTRIYENARNVVAQAFIEGKAIFIEGGNVAFEKHWYKCEACNEVFEAEKDQEIEQCHYCSSSNISNINQELEEDFESHSEQDASTMGRGGHCVCVTCGTKVPHKAGLPCIKTKCPDCGKTMFRENSLHHREFLKNQKGDNSENSE